MPADSALNIKRSVTINHFILFGALSACLPAFQTRAAPGNTPAPAPGAPVAIGAKPAPDKLVLHKKPAWLTELSLMVREGYDDNLFGSGVPPLEGEASWVTTLSPKIGVDLAPALDAAPAGSNRLQTLSVAYAPEFAWYAGATSENHVKHNVPVALKGQAEAVSYGLETSFRYVDGSREAPAYPAGYSAYAIAFPRERREQIQDRSKFWLRYDWEACFVRPAASLLYYDLMTEHRNVPGYLNYVDRYDANGGVDFGYRLTPGMVGIVGYRYGHQKQQPFPWDPTHYSNDYHRGLVGLEGKPWRWLNWELAAGPEFHHYQTAATARGFAGPDLATPYAEGNLSAELSGRDVLTLKFLCRQWVNSSGRSAYLDKYCELGYQRKVASQLGFEASARAGQRDYNYPSLRDDLLLAFASTVRYTLTTRLSTALEYSADLGRNLEAGLALPANREFTRQFVGLNVRFRY